MMSKSIFLCVILLLSVLCCLAEQPVVVEEEAPFFTITPKVHLRIRYNMQDGHDKDPSGTKEKYDSPWASQFFDFRTKAWVDIKDRSESFVGRFTLGNRMSYYVADWGNPRNHSPSHHSGPDVLSIMEAWGRFSLENAEGLKLTIGRQPFTMGNGMVVHDGQPYDWLNYFDGIMTSYLYERNYARVVAFYNYWRDPLSVDMTWEKSDYASHEGRALTMGNVLTLGYDDVYSFSDAFKVEQYYLFNNVEADQAGRLERKMPHDWDRVNMHTLGVRFFGSCLPCLTYSTEIAHQFGQWYKNDQDDSLDGNMLDFRLGWKLGNVWKHLEPYSPLWSFSYTYWTGDEDGSKSYEGWFPVLGCYEGLFGGEEVSNKGGVPCGALWTNLHAFHTDFKLSPVKNSSFNCGTTYFLADYAKDNGKNVGVTLYMAGSYTFNKNLSAKLTLSEMLFGDYYGDQRNHCGFWGRLEVNLFF